MRNQSVLAVMTRTPVAVLPSASVAEAQRLMRQLGCHHLPVVERGELVGMLSSRDLLKALVPATDADPAQHGAALLQEKPVAAIMSRRVTSLTEDATLLEAARLFATGELHALPVLGPGRQLAGIITATDVLELLATELPSAQRAGPAVEREQLLTELYEAVKHYLGSGRGELEHGRLQLAFDAAMECIEPGEFKL